MAEGVRRGLFQGVLLASDFDGTLVPQSQQVTPGVKAALRFFRENGGLFTVCTGRCYLGFHAYSPELINAPVLLANGGMAYDYSAGKIVVSNGIGDEGIAPLRAVAAAFPDVSVEMYPFEKAYAVHLTKQTRHHFTSQFIPFESVDDPAEAPRPWAKVMIGGAPERIAEVQIFLREQTEIRFLPTTGGFLEVLAKGVDKGKALLQLADVLGVKHEDVYAVGDGYNDVEMLRAAARAFVPANGDAFALACADEMVRSNEDDAVAHVVELLTERYGGAPESKNVAHG